MSDTSIIKLPADRPVPPLTIALLAAVKEACEKLGARFVLAGATARDVQFEHRYGMRALSATKDVDVAVCAVSWAFHQQLIDALLATGQFTDDKKARQKLHFQRDGDAHSTQLDLVPFGPLEEPTGSITWEPERDFVMNVLGFEEAVDTADLIDIGGDLVVPVVTIPAFVLLKLMAWSDRRARQNNDALDLFFVLSNYFHAGNQDRVFDEATDLLTACDFDVDIGCAGLLGRETLALARAETRAAVAAILQTDETYAALKDDLIRIAARHLIGADVGQVEVLLDAFRAQFIVEQSAGQPPEGTDDTGTPD